MRLTSVKGFVKNVKYLFIIITVWKYSSTVRGHYRELDPYAYLNLLLKLLFLMCNIEMVKISLLAVQYIDIQAQLQ